MAEQKTDGEVFADYTQMLDDLEAQKAEDYAEAGTLPPGVVTRNPDTTTPEANYVSRDNIVVSGASPAHIQAAVEALATDEARDKALDAADIAQSVSREDYDAAILAAAPTATDEQRQEAPADVTELDEDVSEPDEPRASGGAEVPEGTLEAVHAQEDDDEDGEPFDADHEAPPEPAGEGAQPEHQQESGPDAVASDGKSVGESDPGNPNATTR